MKTREKLNPRKIFFTKGTCSHAVFHLLNHEFDNSKPSEEKASDVLAGGITRLGKQCGMIWGGALAVGAESFKRFENKYQATEVAINASRHVLNSFESRSHTVNCRDIVKVDWANKRQMLFYTFKILAQGMIYSKCFNLIVKWTPEAVNSATNGLKGDSCSSFECLSCASEVVKKMGGSLEEQIMISGFAGGIGLSGNACGALAAAIWYSALSQMRNHPELEINLFKNDEVEQIVNSFKKETGGELVCQNIADKEFESTKDHTEFLQNGGCSSLISVLSSEQNGDL